ncbi:MAG: hypothetical protein IJU21_02775 [Bacteroidales bacterium]|nr:hypothetical protein [Bacteroidales bacterium]
MSKTDLSQAEAHFNKGLKYLKSTSGEYMAFIEFCQALELGRYDACYYIGKLHYDGYTSPDMSQNIPEAIGMWSLGAENGDEKCKEALQEHEWELIPEAENPQAIDYENGDSYEGDVDEEGLPNGRGIMKYAHGESISELGDVERYDGMFCHGVPEGIGRMEFHVNGNGSSEYYGEWKMGLPNGFGRWHLYSFTITETYEGEWKEGMFHGRGKYYEHWDKGTFPDQYYDGEWKEGLKDGQGILEDGKGDVFEGLWQGGNKEGRGKLTRADGTVVEGVWHNDGLDTSSIGKKLEIILEDSGFDYHHTTVCLLNPEKTGLVTFEDVTIVSGSRDNSHSDIITITEIEADGTLHCIIPSRFCQDGQPAGDEVIRPGETKKYSCEKEATATIYDEDYDYTIAQRITLRYQA